MKKLHFILLLLLCNCLSSHWEKDCTAMDILPQIEEYCLCEGISGEYFGGIEGILSTVFPSSIGENLPHQKSWKNHHSVTGHSNRRGFSRKPCQSGIFRKYSIPIVHSARSADKYVLELERIIV